MAFKFDKANIAAVDSEIGVTIRDSKKRWEIFGISARQYSDGNLSFEFFVAPIYKRVKIKTNELEKEELREVAIYIDLSSLRAGLNAALHAKGRSPFSSAEYSRFLDMIKEGVFVQSSWGGWMLERSREYRVDFINSCDDANLVLREGEERMR